MVGPTTVFRWCCHKIGSPLLLGSRLRRPLHNRSAGCLMPLASFVLSLSKDGLGPRLHRLTSYAKVSLRGNDERAAGAGDRGRRLLATLVGMQVTVALGSRLRGNDERGAGAGDRGRRLLATLVGMQVTVALGSRLRGNDERGRGSGGSGRPGERVVGDLGWYASDGCAGFPPSRERREGGCGNDEGGCYTTDLLETVLACVAARFLNEHCP